MTLTNPARQVSADDPVTDADAELATASGPDCPTKPTSAAAPESTKDAAAVPWSYDCVSVKIRRGITNFFVFYARFAYKRPWASLMIALLYIVMCIPGLALVRVENKDENHYIRGSYSALALAATKDNFPFNARDVGIMTYFTAKSGRNLLSSDSLREIGRAMDHVLSSVKTSDGETIDDICERSWRGKCEYDSIFHSLRDQGSLLGVDTKQPANSTLGEVEFLAEKLGAYCADPAKCRQFLKPQSAIVVSQNIDGQGAVEVQSLLIITYLNSNSKNLDEYQHKVLDKVHGPSYHRDKDSLQTDNFWVASFSKAAIEVEGSRPATAESHLMGMAFIVVICFVCCSTVSPQSPRGRILLSLSCIAIVVLALACAIGLGTYANVPLTSMTTLAVFTLLGVSVDDIIVIVHSYERTDPSKSVEDRLIDSLQESGTAISLTSATSLVAFLCAATCPIPTISYFCASASFGILSVYVLQMSLFLPLFILDEHRRKSQRRECCLSLCFGPVPENQKDGKDEKASSCDKMFRCITSPSVGGGCGIMEKFAKTVSYSVYARVAICTLFLVLSVGAVVGSVYSDTDADLSDYYMDTSFMKRYFKMSGDLWSAPSTVYLNIKHEDEGLFTDARRAEIDSLFSDLGKFKFTFGPESNWLRDFDTWLSLTSASTAALESIRQSLIGNPEAFGAKVAEFLKVERIKVPGTQIPLEPWRHNKHVVVKDGKVKFSRLQMNYEAVLKVQAVYIKNWKDTYNLFFPNGHGSDLTDGGRVKNTWVFTWLSNAAERDGQMKYIIFSSLGIACAAVAVTVMIMLDPLIGLFVGALVMALDGMVLALLTAYGVKLDFVAFLCLSMTIGLVVDYATHTSHAYLHHQGHMDDKLYFCIREMGSSVLSGGGSTVLGLCVLAFASSKAFRNFFYVLGTAVFMGTATGIVISPVLLRCLHGAGVTVLKAVRSSPKIAS